MSQSAETVCGVFSHKQDICITHGVGELSGRRIGTRMWWGVRRRRHWHGDWGSLRGFGGEVNMIKRHCIRRVNYRRASACSAQELPMWRPTHQTSWGSTTSRLRGNCPADGLFHPGSPPFPFYKTPGALWHTCSLHFGDGPSDALMKRAFLLGPRLPAFFLSRLHQFRSNSIHVHNSQRINFF